MSRYEHLLEDPYEVINEICNFLSIKYKSGMLKFTNFFKTKWLLGDQKIYSTSSIIRSRSDEWIGETGDPQIWRALNDYLNHIGRDTLKDLGYDFKEINKLLSDNKPIQDDEEMKYRTFPLFPSWIIQKTAL